MHRTARRAAVVGLTTLTTAVLAACSGGSGDSDHDMNHDTPSASLTPAPSAASPSAASSRQGDVMFAQSMIPHHEQAVEMADLALDGQAEASTDVRTLAKDIKAAQGPEIKTMQGWLESWDAPAAADGGMDHGAMGHGGMMSADEMKTLESARGAEFDRLWLTMMIKHHEGAVTMAQDVQATTADAEVKKLADEIVTSQEDEIAAMQKLL